MPSRNLYERAAALARSGEAFAVATVVESRGSVPGKAGAKLLVSAKGTWGTIGGAGLEEKIKELCHKALSEGRGGLEHFTLANWREGGLDSVCGGEVTVAIEYNPPLPHLLLFGGGHCTLALARVLDELEYPYTVVDDRPEFAARDRFPNAAETVVATPEAFFGSDRGLSRYSRAYLMGYSHHLDTRLLTLLATHFDGPIGLIGSKAKRHSMLARAEAAGAPRGRLERVECPIGLDLGAETPGEIAVAVAAEIVAQVKGATRPTRAVAERVLAGRGGTADAWLE